MVNSGCSVKTCPQWIKAHPGGAAVVAVLGALLALLIMQLTWEFAAATAPATPQMLPGYPVIEVGDAGTKYVVTKWHSNRPGACMRHAVYLLHRHEDGIETYHTLAATFSGAGLRGSFYNFKLFWALPPDFPPGEWTMTIRFAHVCPPLGLVRWFDSTDGLKLEVP